MKLVFKDLDILAWSSVQPNQIFVDHMSGSSTGTKDALGNLCSLSLGALRVQAGWLRAPRCLHFLASGDREIESKQRGQTEQTTIGRYSVMIPEMA